MTDPTEQARREMIPQMPAELAARVAAGEQIWDTEDLRRDFEVLGFLAPFVMVRKRDDGMEGTLEFTHRPRLYFGWAPK